MLFLFQEYNQKIQTLKEEMEEATNSAEQVRNEIQSFRNCFTYINSADKCEVCNMILMVRPFYFFPCNHMFHSDCLLAELEPCLGKFFICILFVDCDFKIIITNNELVYGLLQE